MLTLIAVLCNIIFCSVVLLRETMLDRFPCPITFWVTSVIPPVFVLILSARFIQLAFAYRTNEEALMVTSREPSRDRSASVANSVGEFMSKQYRDRSASVSSMASVSTLSSQMSGMSGTTKKAAWYTRNRRQVSTSHIVYYITGFMVLYMIALVVIQVMSVDMRAGGFTSAHPTVDCTRGWEYIPMYSVLGVCLFVLNPLLLVWFRGIDDAYGIRVELVWTWVIWTVAVVMEMVWVYTPTLPPVVRAIWPHYDWLLVGFAMTHIMSVIRPTWMYWRQRGATGEQEAPLEASMGKPGLGSKRAFELVLTDVSLFEEFKRFAVKDFSVENVLFYERVEQFRNQSSTTSPGLSAHTLDHIMREARKIFYLFLRHHADLQLNVSARVIRQVETEMRLKRFTVSMFDPVLMEVLQLMWTDTYPRFIRGMSKEWRREVTRRAMMLNGGMHKVSLGVEMASPLAKFMGNTTSASARSSLSSIASTMTLGGVKTSPFSHPHLSPIPL